MRISAFSLIPSLPVAREPSLLKKGRTIVSRNAALRYLVILLFVFSLFALCAENLSAADFTISPVRVFIAPGKKAEVVTIKNNSDENLTVQMSSFLWEQDAEA